MDKNINFKINLKVDGKSVLHDISIDAADFKTAVAAGVSEAKRLGGALKDVTQSAIMFSALKDSIDVLNGAVGSLADTYNDFDDAMRAANTMAGEDKAGFQNLKKDVEELAKTIPLAKNELANGLYQVISNGVPKDNWISYLEASSKSAVGGIADLSKVVTVTSTVIKNYGLNWDAAGAIQDKIQLTAKFGVTTFEQLSEALPRVSGSAATLGVSVNELMATFATLTGVSGNTAEVSTQLAAVFTALIKPSGEAAEMATQMGIQFDAAAIKAAGGMQNFLSRLTVDVERYAAANGVLEQEIYGRLFGSAEALRGLIPITGELSQKFSENVAEMSNSTGTMDDAFAQMVDSGRNMQQIFKNNISTILDFAGSTASAIQPEMQLLASFGQTALGLTMLIKYFNDILPVLKTFSVVQLKNAAASAIAAVNAKVQAVAQRLLAASTTTATVSTTALTAATIALYSAMTLGLAAAIYGITKLITNMSDAAEDSAEGLQSLKDASSAYSSAVSEAKASLDIEISKLRELIKANKDTTSAVEDLNTKYADIFGSHKTAAEWYDTLIQKSAAYAQQLGYEAQAKILASKKAANELRLEEIAASKKQMEDTGKATWTTQTQYKTGVIVNTYNTKAYQRLIDEEKSLTDENIKLTDSFNISIQKSADAAAALQAVSENTAQGGKAVDIAKMSYDDLSAAIDKNNAALKKLTPDQKEEITRLNTSNTLLSKRRDALAALLGVSTKSTNNGAELISSPAVIADFTNNIEYYQKKLEETKKDDTEAISIISAKITKLKEERAALQAVYDAAGRPTELNTLQDIDAEITYQRGLRQTASKEQLSAIDAEIDRLNTLKTTFEERSITPIDSIKTFAELSDQISIYEARLQTADETQRPVIQQQINQLKILKESWMDMLDAMSAPSDISQLNNIRDLDSAINYYSAQQQKASSTEIENIQRTIDALNVKRAALTRLTTLPQAQSELTSLGSLTDKKLEIQLDLIGLDGIKQKINDLQVMLDDTTNPLTDDQRKSVESMMQAWTDYEKVLIKSKASAADAWGSVKSIGNAVENMTQALQGNGSAWQAVTSIVDGFIAISSGIKDIIAIIDALTTATNIKTAATGVSAAVTAAETQIEVTGAVEKVAASAAVVAARKTETTANIETAASGALAANAGIPFIGIALGAVAVGAILAMMAGLPKFADGGIAYGPTLGLFGEYPGAANNPEVVAPLDKLQSMIGDNSVGGKVEFRIAGRDLVGVLEKESNIRRRS